MFDWIGDCKPFLPHSYTVAGTQKFFRKPV